MKNVLLILISLIIFGCNSKNDGIKYGTFDLYENNTIVGTIYRMNNYQFEKYLDGSELIARIEYRTDSTYLLIGMEENPIGIDSIIWLTTYKEISPEQYIFSTKLYNSNINYRYDGLLLKLNNNIPKAYREKLNDLELN